MPRYETSFGNLIWPRTVATDDARSMIFVGEFLGRIWEFSTKNESHARLVVDLAGYGAGMELQSLLYEQRKTSKTRTHTTYLGLQS